MLLMLPVEAGIPSSLSGTKWVKYDDSLKINVEDTKVGKKNIIVPVSRTSPGNEQVESSDLLLNYTGRREERERGQTVSFNCTADGFPQPTIVWRKDGQLIIIGNTRRNIRSTGGSSGFRSQDIPGVLQITSTLTITGLRGSDSGSYSCRADNEANIGAVLRKPFTLEVVERKYNI